MDKLDNNSISTTAFVPEEVQVDAVSGERELSPYSLSDINNNEEALLDYLASILVEAFLDRKKV